MSKRRKKDLVDAFEKLGRALDRAERAASILGVARSVMFVDDPRDRVALMQALNGRLDQVLREP